MPSYGGNPKLGLLPRDCEGCGEQFQPYRSNARVCSRACYRKLPEVKAASAYRNLKPDARARKNAARRLSSLTDPEEIARRKRKNLEGALSRYGLDIESYDRMLEMQGGLCAICEDPPDPNGVRASSRLHVDHCHETGRIRALLCTRCNRAIGYLRDRPDLALRAAEYLESYRE